MAVVSLAMSMVEETSVEALESEDASELESAMISPPHPPSPQPLFSSLFDDLRKRKAARRASWESRMELRCTYAKAQTGEIQVCSDLPIELAIMLPTRRSRSRRAAFMVATFHPKQVVLIPLLTGKGM